MRKEPKMRNWLTVFENKDPLIKPGEIHFSHTAYTQIPDLVRHAALQRHWRGEWESPLAADEPVDSLDYWFSCFAYGERDIHVATTKGNGPDLPFTWLGFGGEHIRFFL